MTKEHLYYNALALGTKGGYAVLAKLKDRWTTWESAHHALRKEAATPDAHKAWEELETRNVRLILREESAYPPLLKEIPWAQFGIYYRGTLPDPSALIIAIVGTRKASERGLSAAQAFGKGLGSYGATVVSGLALGVDGAAHAGCLASNGKTIAVLANGLDAIYPRQHERLGETILARGGSLMSEYPIGTPSLPRYFIERNRIVSGLARAVVVIEAPIKSGSLATARFALDQNRHVAVLPGPMEHPHYRGSHALIRSGATLTTSPEELLEDIGESSNTTLRDEDTNPLTDVEKRILEVLKARGAPMEVDKIIEVSQLETQVVTRTLTLLVLKHAIKEESGGYSITGAHHR